MRAPNSTTRQAQKERVTVRMPATVGDLRDEANRHFGHHGVLRMWHQENDHEPPRRVNAQRFQKIIADDVVDVTWRPVKYPQRKSAYQRDFVEHPLEARPPVEKAPVPETLPFEGQTSYSADFVRHKAAAGPKVVKPKHKWEASKAPTEPSTYREHFPGWTPPQRPTTPKPRQREELPFEGQSRYASDFVRHEVRSSRPKSAGHARPSTGPFTGVSTYNEDFIRYRDAPRPATADATQRRSAPAIPFKGTSEYRKEFNQKGLPRQEVLHLEPQGLDAEFLARRPKGASDTQSSSGRSAP